jgi:heme exporter protein A
MGLEHRGVNVHDGGGILLVAQDIVVTRGGRVVLRSRDLAVEAGQAVVITGPNGAGKSTLLRVLAGLARPELGTVTWDGADIRADRTAHALRLGYLGHLDGIKADLTVRENLALAARLHGGLADTALGGLQMQALGDVPARLLSAGQRRRVALCRLLLGSRRLWLLDEPTIGLDQRAKALLGEALTAHRAGGGMVVATTHEDLPLGEYRSVTL